MKGVIVLQQVHQSYKSFTARAGVCMVTLLHCDKVPVYGCSTSLVFFRCYQECARLLPCSLTSTQQASQLSQAAKAHRLLHKGQPAVSLGLNCGGAHTALRECYACPPGTRGRLHSTIRVTTASVSAARAPAARAASACRTDCSAAATCWYASTACEQLLLEAAEGQVPARCGSAEGRRSDRTGPHWLASVSPPYSLWVCERKAVERGEERDF